MKFGVWKHRNDVRDPKTDRSAAVRRSKISLSAPKPDFSHCFQAQIFKKREDVRHAHKVDAVRDIEMALKTIRGRFAQGHCSACV